MRHPFYGILIRVSIFLLVLLIVGGSFLYRAVSEQVALQTAELQARQAEVAVLGK